MYPTNSYDESLFPVVLEILPHCYFNISKSIAVIGCRVVEGIARKGTPLVVQSNPDKVIGTITEIQKQFNEVKEARKGEEIVIRIDGNHGLNTNIISEKNELLSKVTRKSIDDLKLHHKDEMTDDDWRCIIKLKSMFNII